MNKEHDSLPKALTLTRGELLFLDDSLPRGFFSRMGRTDPGNIVERICLATLRSASTGTVTIQLVDADLWLLRDLCRNDDFYGEEAVGQTIRTKIYHILFEQQLQDHEVLSQLLANLDLY